ncbi:MAG: ParA family protein [Spirulinaceae cyanobacterium RM2_2_10]|nr:ParA family protein [Spirulinaceae cyanobacterium SM2_1_0]NJO19053.1 ParA family protein [Spirulinaceae cyanobacterium RM2_2_10]
MLTLACLSLSGGQGKTTTAVLLGKRLAASGHPVLVIDADPQSNLTTFLGHDVEANAPTLLEVFRGSVALEDAIYPTTSENLFLIPADDGLDAVQDYLASSGVGAMLLRKRLAPAQDSFAIAVVDCPPQRSQICKSVIGASDRILVPCEATVKGYGSLVRTLDAIAELKDMGASEAELLGVIPFRDRWVGMNQSQESRACIEEMRREVGPDRVLPSIRESERYKQAISKGLTLEALGFPDLEYPFQVLEQRLSTLTVTAQS